MDIEELECRAQPALLAFTVSVPGFTGLDFSTSTLVASQTSVAASARITLPSQANEHAQFEVILHIGNSPTPPSDPFGGGNTGGGHSGGSGTGGSGTGDSGTGTSATSGTFASNPGVFPMFAASAPSAVFSSVLVREATSQLASGMLANATNLTPAGLGLLLPPGQTLNPTVALAPAINPAPPPGVITSQPLPPEGSRPFPDAASIPYLSGESSATVARVGPADVPVAAIAPANMRPAEAVPVKTSQRLDHVIDVPVELVTPALAQAPVEDATVPTTGEPVALATPVAEEEGTSPWMWATVLGAAAAGTSWVAWRCWLKPPVVHPDDRAWRTCLLGLDFDQFS